MLTPIDPALVDIDLRYATADNITGAPIYKRPRGFLHAVWPDAEVSVDLGEGEDRLALEVRGAVGVHRVVVG